MIDTDGSNNVINGNTVDVIDLINEDYLCDPLYNGHITNIIGAIGGRIDDEFVYCGGSIEDIYSGVTKECRILGKGYPGDPFHMPLDLTIPMGRATSNGGVILPNNTLFIAGKLQYWNKGTSLSKKAY